MLTRTKIICTIGPACNTYEEIIGLVKAGMNVARLNFSHGIHEEHAKIIALIKQVRQELGVPLAVMLDTRGPEVRLGNLKGNELFLKKGDSWLLVKEIIDGDQKRVSITPPQVLDDLVKGTRVLFDDGYISSTVCDITDEGVRIEIENGGRLKSLKGVNIPNVSLNLPAVTEKDIHDIRFGCQQGIEFVAASFVRTADNIITVKNILADAGKTSVQVIAKLENHEGIENFDSILQVADGVMVARGDLGVEIPLSRVPRIQKEMLRKCYLAGKPAVTATQMLESMISNPRPTRAEVSDVANAIYDSTSSVMLSGETAVGLYPKMTIQVMKSVIKETEGDFDYRRFLELHSAFIYHDVPSSVTLASVKTAYSSNAKAIFAFTSGGNTARLLSRLRPEMPIVAMTTNRQTYHQMAFYWGVIPVYIESLRDLKDGFEKLSSYSLEKNLVSYGDLVIVIAGSTFGITGTTNLILVENIGDVLVRGNTGIGARVYGNVNLLLRPDDSLEPYTVRGQILILTCCDEPFLPFVREAAGVVLQSHIDDTPSELFLMEAAKEHGKTAIIRADNAVNILKNGQLVTLDPEKALVYKGVVLT